MSDDDFPLVEQLLEAKSRPVLAALLLRMPDFIVWEHHNEVLMACLSLNFEEGRRFGHLRHLAGMRVRDAHGLIPQSMAIEIEELRQVLSRLASGEAPAT